MSELGVLGAKARAALPEERKKQIARKAAKTRKRNRRIAAQACRRGEAHKAANAKSIENVTPENGDLQ